MRLTMENLTLLMSSTRASDALANAELFAKLRSRLQRADAAGISTTHLRLRGVASLTGLVADVDILLNRAASHRNYKPRTDGSLRAAAASICELPSFVADPLLYARLQQRRLIAAKLLLALRGAGGSCPVLLPVEPEELPTLTARLRAAIAAGTAAAGAVLEQATRPGVVPGSAAS